MKGSFVSAVLCSLQKELAEILMNLQCIAMKNVVNHLMSLLIYYKSVHVGFSPPVLVVQLPPRFLRTGQTEGRSKSRTSVSDTTAT